MALLKKALITPKSRKDKYNCRRRRRRLTTVVVVVVVVI